MDGPKKIGKIIGTGLVAVGLLSPEIGHAEKVQNRPRTEISSIEKRDLSEEEKVIENVFGIPYQEIAKNFEIKIPIQNGISGNYVIHVGQIHVVNGKDDDKTEVANCQLKIYRLLESLNKGKVPKFSKAYVESRLVGMDNYFPILKKFLNQMLDLRKNLPQEIAQNKDRAYKNTLNFLEMHLEWISEDLNNYNLFGETIDSIFDYIYEKFQQDGLQNKELSEHFTKVKNIIAESKKDYGQPNILNFGGTELVNFKYGWPKIISAENRFLNIDPTTSDQEFQKIMFDVADKYKEFIQELDSDWETNKVKIENARKKMRIALNNLELAQKELKPELHDSKHEEKIMYKRESFAIPQLPRNESSLLIYGQDHDFEKAVRESNSASPVANSEQNTLGLIKLVPKN